MKGFRVYDKDVEKYVTDELYWLVDSDGALKSLEDGYLVDYPSCIREDDTGLTDKNGTKIFEGDVVRHEAFGNRAVVWGCKYLEMTTTGWWLCKTIVPLSSDIKSLESKNSEIEVIGNIHDNPELLEENDNENNT